MDIIEVEGLPLAKRGMMSGSKIVWRCPECSLDPMTLYDQKPPHQDCTGEYQELLKPFMAEGKLVIELPDVYAIRSFVLQQVKNVEL